MNAAPLIQWRKPENTTELQQNQFANGANDKWNQQSMRSLGPCLQTLAAIQEKNLDFKYILTKSDILIWNIFKSSYKKKVADFSRN